MKTQLTRVAVLLFTACGPQLPYEEEWAGAVQQPLCANPDGCFPEDPKPEPMPPLLTGRTATSLTIQYTLSSEWTLCRIERRAPGGTWTTATSVGCSSLPRWWDDQTRLPDSITCYRLKASNARGAGYSGERCGLTLPSGGSSPSINRLQLRLKVANVSDAETGNRVSVRLSSIGYPGINQTGLNTAPRIKATTPLPIWEGDFARGRDFTYELELRNLKQLRDITQIRIVDHGSDGLCIESIDLLVNGRSAFAKNFGVSTCRWLDTDGNPELVVPFDELRSAPSFASFQAPPPNPIVSRDELEARLEGMIGNVIWARSDIDWGKIYNYRAVEVQRVTDGRLHVDLDLEGIINNAPNAEVDVDFDGDVTFARNSTNDGYELMLAIQNFRASSDLPWWAEALGVVCSVSYVGGGSGNNCATIIERYVEDAVERAFSLESKRIPFVSDADLRSVGCTMPTVTVTAEGGLWFSCF